ncbi:ABC transporter permease [Pseudooceanicola algae]|uniref:Bicarbonate transport system permease protein CmpB n=1 Tax=Pseudooceanicola algae TaxID=1537215 RepID=A0A418SFR2_9RHOB|nr:ABC transporter permease subunit [Pseudooceanicola algae]QPM91538.1 Bicarbonate transport system permease protein CmpB [Pseudooceanicola algae]
MKLTRHQMQDLALGIIGILLFLIGWEMIGYYKLAGLTWPRFSTVMAYLFDPSRRGLFGRAMASSFSMILGGYVLGFVIGLGAAMLSYLVKPLQPGVDRLASTINAIPPIALAPLFIVLLSRDVTGMAIATINVFFVIYVAATSGLERSRQNHRDLFAVLGASRVKRLIRLDLPAALPSIVSGMKYATPAAFIGAILGEWFGASRGLGLLMVSAMQNFQIPLLWSAVFIASAASLIVFGLMSLLERFVHGRFS